MNKSVIVYGPQGCGKTQNAELLREHFGLQSVVELDEVRHPKLGAVQYPSDLMFGKLLLTSLTLEEMTSRRWIETGSRRVVSFDEAMADVKLTQETRHSTLANAGNILQRLCHGASVKAGWWSGEVGNGSALDQVRSNTRIGKALVAEKMSLIHSEGGEATEGFRKDLMDQHLTHRKNAEVELADMVIRIADLAGALGYDLGGAIAEKMAFNAVRPDHKKEAREAAGGKAY